MSYTFSIVVPVYNVREYLDECMRSLLAQTYPNYEILLVDDGSTDGSGEACDGYKSENCRVFHKPNGGLSDARNTGIRAARGEYLLFVDSDDYIAPDSLEKFYAFIDQFHPDIVCACSYKVDFDGTAASETREIKKIGGVLCGREYYEAATRQKTLNACVPFNLYKRAFILDNNFFFKVGVMHEDELWTPKVFYTAKSVIGGGFFFYYYRMRQGSITNQASWEKRRKNGTDLIASCQELAQFAALYTPEQSRWLRDHISALYMSATYSARLDKTDPAALDRFFPLRYAYQPKNRIKAALYAVSPKLYCILDNLEKGASK